MNESQGEFFFMAILDYKYKWMFDPLIIIFVLIPPRQPGVAVFYLKPYYFP